MKILFITHYSSMYGANKSLCSLLLDLRSTYKLTPLVLLPSHGAICEFLEKHQIEYIVSPFYWWVNSERGVYKCLLNIRKQIVNYYRINAILAMLEDYNIGAVYSNSIVINLGYFISSRLNCPHIWHFRESMDSYNFKFSLGKRFAAFFFIYSAQKYILISDYLMRYYSPLLPHDRVIRIYNGLSLNCSVPSFTKMTNMNIAVVGVISSQKNQMDILRASLLLRHRGYANFTLHFIGTAQSSYLTQIKTFLKENNLDSFCQFHGHVSNVHALLDSMHLGIVTSRDEAFGRVSIEYMLHSMPVIASNSGANPELIKMGENGFLYELFNSTELANYIEYFLNNSESMRKMGIQARKFAEANFSQEQNSRNVYEVICSVL
ncbi:glycosyltransferase family 4 protein [Spirosoma panaciterrae]|uniref:glycosyltransferase family 4 protein n=1 Tax=Spirosoma panaciterrae TaxID=496058 RepID=UPI0003A0E4A6|nr:glycosyltransferase family 4 protein [Spirosoma panaciterrae]